MKNKKLFIFSVYFCLILVPQLQAMYGATDSAVPPHFLFNEDELEKYTCDACCHDCRHKGKNMVRERGPHTCCFCTSGILCCGLCILGQIIPMSSWIIGLAGCAGGVSLLSGCGECCKMMCGGMHAYCCESYDRRSQVRRIKAKKRRRTWRISASVSGEAVHDEQFPSLGALAAAATVAGGVASEDDPLIPQDIRDRIPFGRKKKIIDRFRKE